MSQKTNCLSLRLQKTNRNFDSPSYWDHFYQENSTYQNIIDDYTKKVYRENQYCNALFSAKAGYQKVNVFVILQAIVPLIKEKLLKLNLNVSRRSFHAVPVQQHVTQNAIKNNVEKTNLLNLVLKQNKQLGNNRIVSNLKSLRNWIKQENKTINRSWKNNIKNVNDSHFLNCDFVEHFKLQNDNTKDFTMRLTFDFLKCFYNQTHWFLSHLNSKNGTTGIFHKYGDTVFPRKKDSNIAFSLKTRYQKKPFFLDHVYNSIFQTNVYIETIRFTNLNQSVMALLDTFVFLLEKRVSFTKISNVLFKDFQDETLLAPKQQKDTTRDLKNYLQIESQNSNYPFSNTLAIKGIRISCSGRLGGRSKKAQKAKMQSHQYGRISLSAFCSKVLFARKSAYTAFGKIGVKIWVRF